MTRVTRSQPASTDANFTGRRRMWADGSSTGARDDFADLGLRADIQLSWRRSQQALAPMDKVEVPFADLDDDAHRLLRAIQPVLARFAEHLRDTRFSLVLADRDGRVVRTFAGQDSVRRDLESLSIDSGFVLSEDYAGTNGIGTVLEEGRPLVVIGAEHYSEPLRGLTCAGTPLVNPVTGRLEGVLDLACPSGEWSDLMAPALAQLRHDVEHELGAKASLTERLIFERFTARCRLTSAAVAAISDQYMITNAAAADLLAPADQGVIWKALTHGEDPEARPITLSNGRIVQATSQVIRIGESVGGHLVELALRPDATPPRRSRRVPGPVTFETVVDQSVRTNPRRLLILGERGTGKVTAAHQIHERLYPGEPITVLPCELAHVADGRAWLADLAAHLQGTGETVVLRHVDLLSEPVAQAVVALVDRSPAGRPGASSADSGGSHDGPRVFATASPGFTDASFRYVHESFGAHTLTTPPVRDQRPQLPAVAASILKTIDPDLHIAGRAVAAMENYDWPGNFTQLRSVLARAAEACGGHVIGLEHLPAEIAGTLRGPQALSRIEELEREAIIAALREQHGNKVRAADALGMSRSTFYRRLRQLRLDPSALLS